MHKHVSILLLVAGSVWTQIIPERNCMSNPFMNGCPAAEEARKTQELLSKKPWWEEHPELLNHKLPGSDQPSGTAKPNPAPVADSDWKRPRLTKALAADWPRWTFAQPDAGALVGMKLPALLQFAGTARAPQIDEVWLCIRPLPGQKNELVMLLIGPAVETIASDLRSKGITVCFLDKRTLLTGEWGAVNRALGRVIAATPGPMSKRAQELWSSSDLWLIAGKQMVNQILPQNTDTAGLTGASLGLSIQNKVAINMLLTGTTAAETARWVSKLSQDPADLGLGDVKIEKTPAGISVKAAFDAAQMPDSLRRQITDQIRPVLDLAGPPPTEATGAIVIQGLDDGRKTIPVQKP
jgi:hypothetical protein